MKLIRRTSVVVTVLVLILNVMEIFINQQYPATTNNHVASAADINGLKGEYYDNPDLTGLKLTRTDASVNFNWGAGSPSTTMEKIHFQ